ncbi:MAG: hypothetical protein U5N58_01600 [Actinomycetota bacterium]|nr:hypothetical protein [Actinomycetota bacterium]
MMESAFHFSQYYEIERLKYLCMEMAVLMVIQKKLKRYSYFISYLNVCSYEKVNRLYTLTNILPIKIIRDEVKLTVLQSIGYYLSDKDFLKYEKEVFEMADSWIKDDKRVFAIGFLLIDFMQKNIKRLNPDKVLASRTLFIRKKIKMRFYDDIFKTLIYLKWKSNE